MNDFHISTIFTIVLAVLLMVITPAYLLLQKSETLLQNYVNSETSKFISEVKSSGKITKEAYTDYINKLDVTDYLFEIKIEHQKKVILPKYSDEGVFLNSYITSYENTYEEDIIDEIYKGDGVYLLSFGDYISINVTSRETLVSSNYLNFLRGRIIPSDRLNYIDGGMISNESY